MDGGFKTKYDDTLKSAGSMSPHLHRDRLALKFHREGLVHCKLQGGLQYLKPSLQSGPGSPAGAAAPCPPSASALAQPRFQGNATSCCTAGQSPSHSVEGLGEASFQESCREHGLCIWYPVLVPEGHGTDLSEDRWQELASEALWC